MSENAGRNSRCLLCALCVVPVIAGASTTNLWTALFLFNWIGLLERIQGWSVLTCTSLASDMFPKRAVGSVVGIGGALGGIGGFFIANIVGFVFK